MLHLPTDFRLEVGSYLCSYGIVSILTKVI